MKEINNDDKFSDLEIDFLYIALEEFNKSYVNPKHPNFYCDAKPRSIIMSIYRKIDLLRQN